MTLAALEADLRGKLYRMIDEHLPRLKAVASDPIVTALEAVALSDQGRQLVAALIRELGTPRPELSAGAQIPDGAESHAEPSGAPSDTPIADEAAQALSVGPSVGGQAR